MALKQLLIQLNPNDTTQSYKNDVDIEGRVVTPASIRHLKRVYNPITIQSVVAKSSIVFGKVALYPVSRISTLSSSISSDITKRCADKITNQSLSSRETG